MTESNNNITSSRGGSTNFLAEIADEIGEALINNPQLKSSMIKHTEKVIQKAEEYGQYLRTEWQKSKEAGLTQHDKNKDEEKWSWWTALSKDWMWGEGVYFADDESLGVQFYIKGKPKPDPLSYLSSMVWGSVGEDYNVLELLDYQFVLLAIIHDAQNWQAGRKRIYFNPLQEKTLSDRLCRAVWHHLESKIDSYNFRDVKNTIKTALQTIKASVEQETKNSGDNNTTIPEPNKEKAKKLHEIADALEEWGKYNEKVTNAAEWGTPEAKQIIRKAMTLLVDNLVLLNECKNKYGCHSPLQQCFVGIEQVASLPETKDLGDYRGWTRDFTERHLWGGEKRSLADECVRYANKVDRETGKKNEQKVIISLGEYESEHGNKIGIIPADLEREVQMTWFQLRPVLDRLGRKQLIEGHKGDGYTAYWLPVEFDENDPYKHQCNVKEFRLTQQGQKLYGKIAEKPAETEQGNKDTKSEREGMIVVHKPWYKKRLAKIIGALSVLVLITTLLINLKTIKEWFYSPRIQPSTSKGRQLPLTNENKLSVSLKEICKDIDSRPLAQRSDTAKQYVGIRIQEERLKLLDVNKNPKGDIYLLSMVFPDQSDTSYSTGRRILCDIPKEHYPELNLAKQGVVIYISGQIKEAGARYIKLSDVSLKFD